ncbi:MAG: transcription antitermination factor NusB [Phycisphaera sp.]|nr:transcription antitermination factor NusB [Phycisphaera sp.]
MSGGRRHNTRRLALQALYQVDARGEDDWDAVEASVNDAPGADETVRAEAIAMARHAWSVRERADAMVCELAPEWPTHRQPVVDRSILRLAVGEMTSPFDATPAAVAINEAVELAKEFGTDKSPAFINGVLDKIAKRLEADTE